MDESVYETLDQKGKSQLHTNKQQPKQMQLSTVEEEVPNEQAFADMLFEVNQKNMVLQEALSKKQEQVTYLSIKLIEVSKRYLSLSESTQIAGQTTTESSMIDDEPPEDQTKEVLARKLQKYKQKYQSIKEKLQSEKNIKKNLEKSSKARIQTKEMELEDIKSDLLEHEQRHNKTIKLLEELKAKLADGSELNLIAQIEKVQALLKQ